MSIFETIKDMPIFNHFSEKEKKTFAEIKHSLLGFSKDDVIIKQGEECSSLDLLVKGTVLITKAGYSTPICNLTPGAIFGEMSFLDDGFRSARVKTDSGVRLLVLNRQGIERNKSGDMLAVCKLFLVTLQNISHNIRLTTEVYNKARTASG